LALYYAVGGGFFRRLGGAAAGVCRPPCRALGVPHPEAL